MHSCVIEESVDGTTSRYGFRIGTSRDGIVVQLESVMERRGTRGKERQVWHLYGAKSPPAVPVKVAQQAVNTLVGAIRVDVETQPKGKRK